MVGKINHIETRQFLGDSRGTDKERNYMANHHDVEQSCVSVVGKNAVIFALSLGVALSLVVGIALKGYFVFRAVVWYGAY